MEDVVNSPSQTPQPSANSKKQPRRGRISLLIFLLIVAIAGVGYYLYQQKTEDSAEDYPIALVSGTVYIGEQAVNPATITIKKGESVTWINNDENPHQIVSDPHPQHETLPGLYSVEQLKTGDSFTYTFGEAGTYTYHDELNPFVIKGTVVVE